MSSTSSFEAGHSTLASDLQLEDGIANMDITNNEVTNNLQTSSNDVQTAPLGTRPQVGCQLLALPNELLQKIMNELYGGESGFSDISLGLTCMKFYDLLKLQRPAPISDQHGDHYTNLLTGVWYAWELQSHLADCVGPNYRLKLHDTRMSYWRQSHVPFLSRKVYGDGIAMEQAERDYNDRWYDYKNDSGNFGSPFGKGNDWYRTFSKEIDRLEEEHRRHQTRWSQYCAAREEAEWHLPEEERTFHMPRNLLQIDDSQLCHRRCRSRYRANQYLIDQHEIRKESEA